MRNIKVIDVMQQNYGSAKFFGQLKLTMILFFILYNKSPLLCIWFDWELCHSPSVLHLLLRHLFSYFYCWINDLYVLCMSSLNISGNDIKPVLDVVNPQHKWVFKELKHVSACSVVCYKYCRTTWCFILLDFTVVWFMFPVYSLNILLYISTFGIIVYCTAKLFKMFWK